MTVIRRVLMQVPLKMPFYKDLLHFILFIKTLLFRASRILSILFF